MPDEGQFVAREEKIQTIFQQVRYSVPMYQRPYRWEADPVKQLWADIIEFYKEDKQKAVDGKVKYFLGPIVTFKMPENDQNQIIDGQQRITTLKILLYLLWMKLKKFNRKSFLEGVASDDEKGQDRAADLYANVAGIRKDLVKCLWLWENDDARYDQPLLSTDVIGCEKKNLKEVFDHESLKEPAGKNMDAYFREGTFDFDAKTQKDNSIVHFRNRALLNKLIDHELKEGIFSSTEEHQALLIISNLVLNCCVMLTISCASEGSALRIFNTLNARGQVLSSSDILKAKIFGFAKDEAGRKQFAENWTNFTNIIDRYVFKTAGEELSSDAMFRYLMHIYRSMETIDNTDPGLLKYFESESRGKKRLKDDIFADLIPISKLWTYISNLTNHDFDFDESEDYKDIAEVFTDEAKKYLSVLWYLQNNPYWRYLVSNFFYRFFIGKEKIDVALFKEKLPVFLKYLTAFTFSTLLSPGDYKNAFYKQRAKVLNSAYTIDSMTTSLWWNIPEDKNNDFRSKIKSEMNSNVGSSGQASRALLLLHAYLDPKQIFVQDKFDIEHIFPQNLKAVCVATPELMSEYGMTAENIDEELESFGNKMALEKNINRSASDNPWMMKKSIYTGNAPWQSNRAESKHPTQYQEAIYLAGLAQITRWCRAHIEAREKDFLEKIMRFLSDPTHDFSNWERPDYKFEDNAGNAPGTTAGNI